MIHPQLMEQRRNFLIMALVKAEIMALVKEELVMVLATMVVLVMVET